MSVVCRRKLLEQRCVFLTVVGNLACYLPDSSVFLLTVEMLASGAVLSSGGIKSSPFSCASLTLPSSCLGWPTVCLGIPSVWLSNESLQVEVDRSLSVTG